MKEKWKDVVGYEGLYEVSTFGRVWSKRYDRFLVPAISGGCDNRYSRVTLCRKGKQSTPKIHVLVLEAFVGPRPSGKVARHFPDRDTTNCRLDNLSWATPSRNSRDRKLHGTELNQHGEKGPRAILTRKKVKKIRRLYRTGEYSMADLGLRFKVTAGAIWMIIHHKTWKRKVA